MKLSLASAAFAGLVALATTVQAADAVRTDLSLPLSQYGQPVQFKTATSPRYPALQSNLVGPLFDSGGFETYTNATLIGQNTWGRDSGANTQWNVTGTTNKFVAAGPATATSWAFPPLGTGGLGYVPLANEVVSVSVDIAASDPTTSATDPFGYLVDIYGNTTGARVARIGLAYSANTVVPVVTTRFNTTTQQFDPTAAVTNVIIGSALTPGSFFNFEVRLNFATKTFGVFSAGTPLSGLGNLPFAAATELGIGDADLQISGAAGAGTSGGFDNYSVSVLAIPEPTTLSVVGGVAVAALRRRRQA